jgi:hypothetical protein
MLLLPFLVYGCWAAAAARAPAAPEERVQRAVAGMVPQQMTALVTAELRLLSMALFSWGGGLAARDPAAFSSASVLAPMLLAVVALGIVETALLHLILARWSSMIAWVATGLGLFSLIYIVGLAKSLVYLPSRLEDNQLLVRLGHFQKVEVPYQAIVGASLAAPCQTIAPETLNLAIMSSPNVLIELDNPRSTVSLTGKRRTFDRVALKIDRPEEFLTSLAFRLRRCEPA